MSSGRLILQEAQYLAPRLTGLLRITPDSPLIVCLLNHNKQAMADACSTGPFCQLSSEPSTLPPGLCDPPVYSPPPSSHLTHATLSAFEEPPSYTSVSTLEETFEKAHHVQPAEDVLHFLDPTIDTIPSLSLRYGVPQSALRKANGLYANHLLAARRTVLVPGEFYKGGVSLSPKPVEGEEEEIRKSKVRRWMVACKVAE